MQLILCLNEGDLMVELISEGLARALSPCLGSVSGSSALRCGRQHGGGESWEQAGESSAVPMGSGAR